MNIGIVGCGAISGIYLRNLHRLPGVAVQALADLDPARAAAKLDELRTRWREWDLPGDAPAKLPRVLTVPALLADPEVDLVLNLTVPKAHAEIAIAALQAGKHTYSEKPLGIDREEGRQILETAARSGRIVGCAPDTFLGAGIETCRQLLREGAIGRPVACAAFMLCPGHESWHPDPEFYYQRGGGPMLDMGPYYLTALISLLGPVGRVCGFARRSHAERTITSEKKRGTRIPVEVQTHYATSLEFASGVLGTMIMSFDAFPGDLPRIEIYGDEGTLSVPDPNTFGGPVRVRKNGEWREEPLRTTYSDNWRGLGVADLAEAIRDGRAPRASGSLAYHVLDIMQAAGESSERGTAITMNEKSKSLKA